MRRYFFYLIVFCACIQLSCGYATRPLPVVTIKGHPAECKPGHLDHVLPCYLTEKEPDFQWTQESKQTEIIKIDDNNHQVKKYSLKLVSLRWRQGEKDQVDMPIWQHRLTIYIPEKVTIDTALLYIDGGIINQTENNKIPVRDNGLDFPRIAARSQSVVIDLKDVPNQFLRFGNGEPLREDNLIAYTWSRFMTNPVENANWPLRMPMVKAVVSAMNASQEMLKEKKLAINNFVISGASKRGWTAWLVASMDTRVTAVIPIVADFLNLTKVFQHLFRVYPQGNPSIAAYMPIRHMIGTDPMNKLLSIIDPYQYRHLLTMPKYAISASGDSFLPPDISQFFFPDLLGRKWLRVLPNINHYVFNADPNIVSEAVESFYGAFIKAMPIPELTWKYEQGTLNLSSSVLPKSARLWQASNSEARDFRQTKDNVHASDFVATPLKFTCDKNCTLAINLPAPKKGWNASFAEVSYGNPPYQDLVFTTRLIITPDHYPESEPSDGNVIPQVTNNNLSK
ncbi:MAG: PhoPQ-activated protein PqaA family protein [Candidatus Endonucleobacter bathymodioli]|uniref:PhoPQ-activated protein PqaA family protein n=1 Tax=Candidatus Endonucleibacter bathymodioli TaxID=539814 RepID=A0AA90NWB3_9GAMM|nr:PhoPQ-activated protein PqaA family protein [Candidatus Endonucleobacter bathymodioli]